MKVVVEGYAGGRTIKLDGDMPDVFVATHGSPQKAARVFAKQHRADKRFAACTSIAVRTSLGVMLADVKGPALL